MNQIIQTYLNSVKVLCPKLSNETLDELAKGLVISEFKPKYFYLQANTIQREIGYVHSGLLRAFFINDKGNEITVNFIRENNYVAHYTSLDNPKPSKFYFQCIEPSLIIKISYEHIRNICDNFPEFERYVRILVEKAHSDLLVRMQGFLFDNAETRYLHFLSENPDLFNRVSLSYLCTYLGIERQSLTRIRKKIAEN